MTLLDNAASGVKFDSAGNHLSRASWNKNKFGLGINIMCGHVNQLFKILYLLSSTNQGQSIKKG